MSNDRKSVLLDRIEKRHLNLKAQDDWALYEGLIHRDTATLAITMKNANGQHIGNLYLNEISLEMLEKLHAMVGPYIEDAKTAKAKNEEAIRIYNETGVLPWEQIDPSSNQ